MWGETYCPNGLFFILEPLEGEASGKGFRHLWTKYRMFACPVPITIIQRIFGHREALLSSGTVVCVSEALQPQSSMGEQRRRKQLQMPVRKYVCLGVGREYKFTRDSRGLRTFQFANSAFSAAFEEHPKAPTAPSEGAGWEVFFLGMFCHLVPSWEISARSLLWAKLQPCGGKNTRDDFF